MNIVLCSVDGMGQGVGEVNITATVGTQNKKTSRYLAWELWMIALCGAILMSISNVRANDIRWIEIEAESHLGRSYGSIWTAEDYRKAKPLKPEVRNEAELQQAMLVRNAVKKDAEAGLPKEHAAALPFVDSKPDLYNFIHPHHIETEKNHTVRYIRYANSVPKAIQPLPPVYPHTSSLVNPFLDWLQGLNAEDQQGQFQEQELRVDLTWPYKTVGTLFFRKNDDSSWFCSAAVISQRLVVTAGQCVHSGKDGDEGFHKDWRFVPAYRQRDGSAPFGRWVPRIAAVPGAWTEGGGTVPNTADFAVLEMKDQIVETRDTKIGELLGYLGWKENSLSETIPIGDTAVLKSHLTVVGYPPHLRFFSEDKQIITEVPVNTLEMRQVTGPVLELPDTNTYLFGTDWGQGSIGAPMVRYWGWTINDENEKVINLNYVVSVVSYLLEEELLQGGSQLDATWREEVWDFACNKNPGNCSSD
jgi:hypothetical protein